MSTTSEYEAAVAGVRRAIVNEGPRPDVHRRVMQRHRNEWPTLWRAIDQLLAAQAKRHALLGEREP